MRNDLLTIWVIYRHPSDYPGKWVLRGQDAMRDGTVRPHGKLVVADSLEAARAWLPPGLDLMQRHPADDPAIYETWL